MNSIATGIQACWSSARVRSSRLVMSRGGRLSFTKGGMCCRTESFTFQNDAFVRTDSAQCERGGTGPSDMTEFKAHPDTKRYMYESSKVYDLDGAYTKSIVKNTIWSSEAMN